MAPETTPSEPPGRPSIRAVQWCNAAALLLAAVGLLQIAGWLTGVSALRGVGAASAVAPFPKVFSDVDGLETFASEFTLEAEVRPGEWTSVPITPQLYRRLDGPYNRRNVYGAALSYAPRLPPELWEAVYCYALGPDGPLRRELRLPPEPVRLRVRLRTKTRGRDDSWILDPSCAA